MKKDKTLLVGYKETSRISQTESNNDYNVEYVDFILEGVWLERKNAPWLVEVADVDFYPQQGDEVYIVVVTYTTGGSFCTTYGKGCIEGVYKTKNEAYKVEKSIRDKSYSEYAPWIGYFESLENVSIETEVVQ